MIRRFSFKQSNSHLIGAALTTTALAIMPWPLWARVLAAVAVALLATLAFDNRLLTDWIRLVIALRTHRRSLPAVSAVSRGCTAMPGDDVAVRWEGEELVALIAVAPRPFTPTIVLSSGRTIHADTLSTRVLADIIDTLDVPVTADVVSAGWRVGNLAPKTVNQLYAQGIGADPCPGCRRTFILVRVDPHAALPAAAWRGNGISGVAAAATSAATRIAEQLSRRGVDAQVAPTYAIYDQFVRRYYDDLTEGWSHIRGNGFYTTVYSAPGGPDQWWSPRADHTLTRVRLSPGEPPRSTVALTSVGVMGHDPVGWTRLRGGQMAGLAGDTPIRDTHWDLPVGSAGMLVGSVPRATSSEVHMDARLYFPLDAVDAVLHVADPMVTLQVILRSAAIGADIRLSSDPAWGHIVSRVGAKTSDNPNITWPGGARTWLVPHRTQRMVQFNHNEIVSERGRLSVEWIHPREELGASMQ